MPPTRSTEGLEAAALIREELPEIAILILSAHVEVAHAMTLLASGGGIAPNNAFNKPGELLTFRWSLYRGMLMLYPVTGAVSPNPSLGKPWPRISATPSARFLSKRCPPPAGALPP